MTSREKILSVVKASQPSLEGLPSLNRFSAIQYQDLQTQFSNTLQAIGGNVVTVQTLADIADYIQQHFKAGHRLLTTLEGIEGLQPVPAGIDPHELETVELAVIAGQFAVAENGAIWVTESQMQVRVLPFITQHLALVVTAGCILHNMHEAYSRIATENYGFGTFIAGPSKTADIEQSLVLGAHGPTTMTVFLIG